VTGTAVVEPRSVGRLPEHIRQQIEMARIANETRKEMAKLSWGASLDQRALGAIAEWGRLHGVDVTQEIDLLGGRVYLNARYYLRRLSQLIEAGRVEYAVADHIHDDPRLKQLGPEGDKERERRLRERIRYNAPDKAAAVVVFRVKVRGMDQEVTGVNWAGNGVRPKDPVGDAEPVKTAESRAARRAMRQLVGHVREAEEVEAVVESVRSVEVEVERARAATTAEVEYQRTHRLPAGPAQPDDPFAPEATAAKPKPLGGEVIDMAAKSRPSDLFAGEPDPYAPGDAAED